MIIQGECFTIRQIDVNQESEVLEVYRQCEDFLALGPVPFASMRMVHDDMDNSRDMGGRFCGIYIGSEMAGILDFVPDRYDDLPGCAGIYLLMISLPYRGKGLGHAVVNTVENEMRKISAISEFRLGVQVNNEPGIRFWTAMGYRIIGGPEEMPDTTVVYQLAKDALHESLTSDASDSGCVPDRDCVPDNSYTPDSRLASDSDCISEASPSEEREDAVPQYGIIGTLGERTLHAYLKHYIEPDTTRHEVKVGRYFADIMNEEGITEIQTRDFNKLRAKLGAFLPEHPVTIVFPVASRKWLLWIDEDTGEVTKRRLSPRRGTAYDIFPELYKIKNYLSDSRIRIRILLIDLEEYRLLNGWSENRKKGSWRHDRIPVGISDEVVIDSPGDYRNLIPPDLPDLFTSVDFAKASRLSRSKAQTALNVLYGIGAVCRNGKKGNSYIYERNGSPVFI